MLISTHIEKEPEPITIPPTSSSGVSQHNRQRLTRLHRELHSPFTVEEATDLLALEPTETKRLLAHLASRGWLVRVRRGLYATVPLDAAHPEQWQLDPWIVATQVFAPCYIGGWSACSHWELTEQIFRNVVVISAANHVRSRQQHIQETDYLVKVLPEEKLFGTRSVWLNATRVLLSDPARTLVDILDDPSVGGGIRHVGDVLTEYFESQHRNDDLLLDYIERLGNRTVYKRLGYLAEVLALDAPLVVETCRTNISAGYSLLDPTAKSQGRLRRRWNLRLNVKLDAPNHPGEPA